ncbi:MAG: purine-nucleoside phosphorylase [Bacteroidetes bacterium]|jgi:purine-nucleoside phosphorylase|nr:MAG: purine-nucleoside phosphorylase [Bacteroidota bacterium]UCE69091.1 MAG: purine-nucleoside phosphorylase [Flavobacteriaceae bacterium]
MSLHISAKPGEIADFVLMPGDPLRAEWIANTYLEEVTCYNKVRGMLGFTGKFRGKKVSVQGSGMGIPSALIYYTELIREYGVKTIIRVGTAGALQGHLKLRDLVMALSASTTSGINRESFPYGDYAPTADFSLLRRAMGQAKALDMEFEAGNILSADVFYPSSGDVYTPWKEHGVLCVEMETAALYTVAARYGVRALSLLTISDSLVRGEHSSAADRERSFEDMATLALHCR